MSNPFPSFGSDLPIEITLPATVVSFPVANLKIPANVVPGTSSPFPHTLGIMLVSAGPVTLFFTSKSGLYGVITLNQFLREDIQITQILASFTDSTTPPVGSNITFAGSAGATTTGSITLRLYF